MTNRRVRFILGSMFRQGGQLRWRHWLAIGFALSLFTFMQPVIHVIGSTVVVLALAAYIYTTLPHHQQKACEQRLVSWLKQLRNHSQPTLDHQDPNPSAESVEPEVLPRRKKASVNQPGAWPDTHTPPRTKKTMD